MTAYSEEAFGSDDWNGLDWGRDFDFSRPFFDQFFELWYQTPKQTANAYFSENCEFLINAHRNRDCYLVDEIDRSRDCHYGYNIQDCIGTFNCFYARKSELCYASAQIEGCYEVFFSEQIVNCSSSAFLMNCQNCKNCLFCTNLRNANYHIYNRKVSKEEFKKAWNDIFNGSRTAVDNANMQFEAFRLQFPERASVQVNSENCTGNHISNCKNCLDSFNIDHCQDCRYCTDTHYSRDMYDVHIYEGELLYECLHAGPEGYCQFFSHLAWFSKHTYYCSQLLHCNHVFGCSGLKHQDYCIFNKQYPPDDYEQMVARIIDHMIETGEWGEFFPASYSPYGYNQTMAAFYFPIQKNEALQRGFQWKEAGNPHENLEVVMPPDDLNVDSSITQKALTSALSGKRFKITKPELEFHKRYGIPLPNTTPSERLEAFVHRNARILYDRTCQKCQKPIQTTYAPERTETVYCEECYLAEVY